MLGRKGGLGIGVSVENRIIDGGRRVILLLVNERLVVYVVVCNITSIGDLVLLSSDFLCCEEAATRTAGTTHCVFVATFM
jgi:hypothetical protein